VNESRVYARLFWVWLVLRTILWTSLAALTQPNAPLDLIEWLAWGHEWRWGYSKHPPFPGWVAEVFSWLSPGDVWGVYIASYLSIAVCLWTVWRLGCEMLSPRLALCAVLAMEGLIFFNYDASEFSNNVVLNASWAVSILCFHRALHADRISWWLGLGIAVGLGLLSKYAMAFLLVPMILYLIIDPRSRKLLARPGPYIAMVVALALFAPHAVWIVRNDFVTIRYGLDRSANLGSWVNHVTYPVLFLLSQLGRLLPVFLILTPLTGWLWGERAVVDEERRDRDFLLMMVLGPVVLLLLVSLLSGKLLREIWGSPLWTFTGLLLLVSLRLEVTVNTLKRTARKMGIVVVLYVAFALGKNYLEPTLSHRPGRIHFPGKELALELTRIWYKHCDEPFPIVGGECWIAGNISCYAPHRPSMYSSGLVGYVAMDERLTPWTSDEDMRRRGGVIVWDAARTGDDLPDGLRERFPMAQVPPPLLLAYRCPQQLPPARIGFALVLPRGPDFQSGR
jgi:4-amino-4-deoxy-L-arabinose transferase-like glycosyltransferase